MRVLMVDKYYFVKGGAERYMFELSACLERHGHEVIPFAMRSPRNYPTPFEPYFVSEIDFDRLANSKKIKEAIRTIGRVIYSKEAKLAITRVIDEFRPDVAHLHMIDHQLSPSILEPLKRRGIPVLQTCHQYKHVCPSYRLFIMDKQEICERCVGGRFYHAVLQRCHKGSLAASAIVCIESYVHRAMNVYQAIDRFHAPSRFLGEKLKQGGFPANKIWHAFYAIDVKSYPVWPVEEDYFVYFGRISEEKGIETLVRSVASVEEAGLVIVGEGPYLTEVKRLIEQLGITNRVSLVGRRDGDQLLEIVGKARFVVVPSEWYENSPLVVYEAFAMGKPVIGSRIGGIPELVDDGENGFVFEVKNVQELADRIRTLWRDKGLRRQFGRRAREKAEREFDFTVHYPRILQAYRELLNSTPRHSMVT